MNSNEKPLKSNFLQILTLRSKIILGITTILLVAFFSLAYVNIKTSQEGVNESFENEAIAIVSNINSFIGTKSKIDKDYEEIEASFNELINKSEDIVKVTLYSPVDGKYLRMATTDSTKKGLEADSYDIEPLVTGQPFFIEKPEKEQVEILAPIYVSGQEEPYATIGVYFSTAKREALKSQSFKQVGLSLLVSLVLIVVLIYFLLNKLMFNRLTNLYNALQSIFKGNYSYRVKSDSNDEIGRISREFNVMAEMLESRYKNSITDQVTGLYNQFYFNNQLEQEVKRNRDGEEFSLLFIDIDHFKKVNDHLGHMEGDRILASVGKLIQENLREQDILARYGGEEFVVLLPDCPVDQSEFIANRIRASIASYPLTNGLLPVTVSVGSATFPLNGSNAKSLLFSADTAMYSAKAQGRNKVVLSSKEGTMVDEEQSSEEEIVDGLHVKEMIYAFAAAMDAKDVYTQKHSETVSRYSGAVAARMGLTEVEIKRIAMAGLLHDVGKIGVPDHILNKPSKLTDEEFEIVKQHPTLGKNILEHISSINDILDYVEYHQERYDGKGYPKGIEKDHIPLGARIVAVADAFHAMTSSRPYRKTPLTLEGAIEELQKNSGTQFDPKVVSVFLEMLNEWKELGNDDVEEFTNELRI